MILHIVYIQNRKKHWTFGLYP